MLTQERLKELLHYCPDTGVFTWRVTRGGHVQAGRVAGTLKQGYGQIMVDKKHYYAHRLAWLYTHGVWPSMLDHINRDKLDNRIVNLREVTWSQNGQNQTSDPKNTSGYRGVIWEKNRNKWRARIQVNRKLIHIGYFDTVEDAARAYAAGAAIYHTHNPIAEVAA
jgi:hypothetical protein